MTNTKLVKISKSVNSDLDKVQVGYLSEIKKQYKKCLITMSKTLILKMTKYNENEK